jgi:hypothetical protein
MSNLVGMWAIIWDNEGKLKAKAFIQGKADEKYFIVQAINALTGEPNVAKLMTIEQMIDWTFLPNLEVAQFVFDDYYDNQVNRFTFNF